ncbi:hypothetical protein BH10BAC3_BH10BAC3_36410 [soil metagenome]
MRDQLKHFPVNWIDGMKISKNHFIAQDDAAKNALYDIASLIVSPLRYGILPPSEQNEETYNIKISLDNQNTIRVSVLACHAITQGGVRIAISSLASAQQSRDGVPATSFQFSDTGNEPAWWIVLLVNPYERQPAGSPNLEENPPRYPSVVPAYTVQVISDSQYKQYANHPYGIIIGKAVSTGNEVRADDEYIPPCFSISAHPDLVSLYSELDKFLGNLELRCSQIVQKIYKKNQQNELSELVLFLCDRMILFLGQSITNMRWMMMHESPALLFANIASLARVMKNSIDLRIGSGKDEMLIYLSEWCELKQGELEAMLSSLAGLRYDNNDINGNIQKVITFVKVSSKLFETLSKLEFIGKKKESGIFVKEEAIGSTNDPNKARRRFFG